ncbi:predicted protein [Chaetoceros tenuissimus]|uniref:Uncharacterized protein n=1 Tax=Chaetoceros tenuissimus TaxID=426638 RepID=A0AAD3D1A3_9STRA|nr:predicted protein [Chaetoceros tenuissimus]
MLLLCATLLDFVMESESLLVLSELGPKSSFRTEDLKVLPDVTVSGVPAECMSESFLKNLLDCDVDGVRETVVSEFPCTLLDDSACFALMAEITFGSRSLTCFDLMSALRFGSRSLMGSVILE